MDVQIIKYNDISIRGALKLKIMHMIYQILRQLFWVSSKEDKQVIQSKLHWLRLFEITFTQKNFIEGKQRSRKWWSDEENYRIFYIKQNCNMKVWSEICENLK